jgi:hypothetical protein
MEKFCVPEKYRELFSLALDSAVKLGSFSDATLAEALNISKLNAAILIGFMEKCEFIYPASKNEVKSARLSEEEWEKIGRNIDNYVPSPIEEKTPVFVLTPFKRLCFLAKKQLEVFDEGIEISTPRETHIIPADEVCVPHFKKATFWKKGYIFFGADPDANLKNSPNALFFKKKMNSDVEALVTSIISDIENKI